METEKKKEETPEKEPKKKAPKEKRAPKPKGEKKKVPLWAYIAGGVALLAVVGYILIEIVDVNLPGLSSGYATTSIPGAVEVFIDADNKDQGLTILDNSEDGNYEIVDVGRDQAYSTGNGDVLTAPDGNLAGDYYIFFDIQDDIMYQLPEGSEASIFVTYLDQGRDTFSVEYDAISGGPTGDGRFKAAGTVEKTDTGEYLTAEIKLLDALFANYSGGDFRIGDNSDGAEVILRVSVILYPNDTPVPGESEEILTEEMSGEDLFLTGEEIHGAGDPEQALDYYARAIEAGYETGYLYHMKAWAHQNLGQIEESIEGWSRAIELEPENFEYWMERGWRKYDLGDLPGAIEDNKEARELAPGEWVTQFSLGMLYYFTEEDQYKDESHEAFDQAIALEPNNPRSRMWRGELKLFRFEDPESALEDFNIAVEYAADDDPAPLNYRGLAYLQLGEWDLCIDDYTAAIELVSDNPWYFLERGDCYVGIGDNQAAREDYQHFLDIADGEDFRVHIDRVEEWWNSSDN